MIAIQNSQNIYIKGSKSSPIRTGYEQVVSSRVSDTFASTAKQDGVVTSVTKDGMTVRFTDGSERSYALGRVFGKAAGVVHPHTLKTIYSEGSKIKAGHTICYDEHFFEPNRLMPGMVDLKMTTMATVVMIDDYTTLEDGSCITPGLAELMETSVAEIKTVTVDFDQHVTNLVGLNDHLDLDTVLCNIIDPETEDMDYFDPETQALLKRVSAKAPKAKTVGDLERIEVYYHGRFEDISPKLQETIRQIERYNRKVALAQGKPFYGGSVDSSFRIKGEALEQNSVAFEFYITHDVSMGAGDKLVFGNQLKSTVTEVMPQDCHAEDGTPVDAKFGNESVEARIVDSFKTVGMATMLIEKTSLRIADIYFNNAKPIFS